MRLSCLLNEFFLDPTKKISKSIIMLLLENHTSTFQLYGNFPKKVLKKEKIYKSYKAMIKQIIITLKSYLKIK